MNRYLIGVIMCILLASGCKKSEIQQQAKLPQGELIEMALTLPLDQSQNVVSRSEPQTTSWKEGVLDAQLTIGSIGEPRSKAIDDSAVANVWVLQFNGTESTSKLIYKLYVPTYVVGSVVPLLKSATDNRVAIVANTFDAAWSSGFVVGTATWGTVNAASKAIRSQSDIMITNSGTDYLPMSGTTTGKLLGGELNIPLTRTVVQLTIRIKSGEDLSATTFDVQLCGVPNTTWWLPDTDTGVWPASVTTINYPQETVTGVTTWSYKIFNYWIPINRRGTVAGTTGITRATNAPQGATYLKVTFGDIVYTVHLGEDFLTDYNLKGNKHYTYANLTFRTDPSGTDSRVNDRRTLGTLVQTPSANVKISAAGGTAVITSPNTSLGLIWTPMLNNTEGFSLGTMTGSGSTSSIPIVVGLNPNGRERSSTFIATATWPNEHMISQTTITQDLSTFTATKSPTTNIPPAGEHIKITITGTPGLTYEITGADANFYLVNSSERTGTIPSGGSKEVQVKVNPQSLSAPLRYRDFVISCTTPNDDLADISFRITQEKGLTDVRARGYVTTAGDGTGLPAGMYCVGMYGGWENSSYSKALYLDKRGNTWNALNSGTGDDPSLQWTSTQTLLGATSYQNGFYNSDILNRAGNSDAVKYCVGKIAYKAYLPSIGQLIDGIWPLKNTFPDEWVMPGVYWGSTEANKNEAAIQQAPGAPADNAWWSSKLSTYSVRCVAEF